MNPVLSQIYGTGFEKQASYDDDLDLSQISGTDLLELIEMDKQASYDDDLDLSDFSDEELEALYVEAADEQDGGHIIEKMASSGDLEYFDMAGRVQAHAYWDELNKAASYDDGDVIEVDLDDIDGSTLLELIDDGWEFDKSAGRIYDGVKGAISRMKDSTPGAYLKELGSSRALNQRTLRSYGRGLSGKVTGGISGARSRADRVADLLTARTVRRNATENVGRSRGHAGIKAAIAGKLRGRKGTFYELAGAGGTSKEKLRMWSRALSGKLGPRQAAEARKSLGAQLMAGSAGATGLGATGLGAAAYMRKNKKGPWSKGGR